MLLETVPNVSEGRRPAIVERLAEAACSVAGAHLLDHSADADHNRSVYTLAGETEALVAALLRLFETALAEIDLRAHAGVHPRIGAVDVVPFVPLGAAPPGAAVAAARRLAERVAERFGLAVYLYGDAATSAARRELSAIRRGGLAGLAERLADPAWAPDFGPARIDPRAGVSVVGARDFLIAFNVVLATDDLAVARSIARAVRASGGGLPALQAIGVPLASRRRAQVSMNLTDFRQTSLPAAYAAVRDRAAELGVAVEESELIGLVPEAVVEGVDAVELRLREFGPERVLETHLRRLGLAS